MGKIAFINLSTKKILHRQSSPKDIRKYLGGRGLGAKILYEHVGPETDPSSEDNYLIFSTGLLSGTAWPTSARLHVTFKSPLTATYGYSNSGGFFSAELKHAGYDALVITGRAKKPVYLRVTPNAIAIKAADSLWGLTTSQVHSALLGPTPRAKDGRVACIGPAGENLVKVAAIINDHNRAAARGGPGMVMGGKNLKAIHVIAEKRPPTPPALKSAAKKAVEKLKTNNTIRAYIKAGSLCFMDPKNMTGDQPGKNHQVVQVPFIKQINPTAFDEYLLSRKGCYACPIRCGRKSCVDDGPYQVESGGPEYETTNALGPMCWIGNPEAIIYANHLCNEYGLDTISTGVIIAFAMELSQRGIFHEPALSLEWGDEKSVITLIQMIAYRRGIGDILAEGTQRAGEIIGEGASEFAMHVKGMELPRQEPRFLKGFGLGHGTSNRGADHLYGMPALDSSGNYSVASEMYPDEILEELMDPTNEKYKPDILIPGEHYCAISDALGVCKISTVAGYALQEKDLVPAVEAVLGESISTEELLLAGERIVNLERMYNVREGLSRKDDYLPKRFSLEPAPLYSYTVEENGELQWSQEPIDEGLIHNFDSMLDRYYALRNWNREGIPTKETLLRLGLNQCVP